MRVDFAARALVDLATAETYWTQQDSQLYIDLTIALNEAIAFLMERPRTGSPTDTPGLRKWRIGRTPFLLFYRPSAKMLRIVRIRHEHENWRKPH